MLYDLTKREADLHLCLLVGAHRTRTSSEEFIAALHPPPPPPN